MQKLSTKYYRIKKIMIKYYLSQGYKDVSIYANQWTYHINRTKAIKIISTDTEKAVIKFNIPSW
jgi:hypothetical protein